ncbi:WD40-repeat-containing domain protein [Chlamydoabsidia padenii]|nr:WD40-repeat-containing domain protein [Chlamydoabsidia padenii]
MSILQPTAQLKGHTEPVLCVKYAKDTFLGEHVLASGSEDNTCRLWDIRTQRAVKGIKGLQDPVSSVAFAPSFDSSLFYLASGNKVFTYDLRNTGMIVCDPIRKYDFSGDEINSIDINQKQTHLATADDKGEVKVVDLVNHKIYKKLNKKHGNICMSVKFSQRKAWEVWSGGLDCKVYQWDFSKGKPLNIFDTNSTEPTSAQMFNPPFVYALETSNDGQWIVTGLGDSSIQLYDFGDKKSKLADPIITHLENGHSNMVNCL